MKRYFLSSGVGVLLGIAFVSASSCTEKKSLVEGVDGGAVAGSMTVGTPTITPVNPQITDAVTQTPAPVQSLPEQK